jgi:hypothetical protein
MSALLPQEHLLCNARIHTKPHGTQPSADLRHPCGNHTPIGVVAPSSTDFQVHLVVVTTYRHGVFDTECEHVMAQVGTDFGATLAEFTENEAMSTHSRSTRPKVALSHLVNSLKGVSSRFPTCTEGQGFHPRSPMTRCGT